METQRENYLINYYIQIHNLYTGLGSVISLATLVPLSPACSLSHASHRSLEPQSATALKEDHTKPHSVNNTRGSSD